MSMPTKCHLVTTRKGCYEKMVRFELSREVANRAVLNAHYDGIDYVIDDCIIMPVEDFENLCPAWQEEVEFTATIPSDGGWYWYVDKEHPVPKIGFVSVGRFFDSANNESTAHVGRWLFIGPKIDDIPCHKVKIVQ